MAPSPRPHLSVSMHAFIELPPVGFLFPLLLLSIAFVTPVLQVDDADAHLLFAKTEVGQAMLQIGAWQAHLAMQQRLAATLPSFCSHAAAPFKQRKRL